MLLRFDQAKRKLKKPGLNPCVISDLFKDVEVLVSDIEQDPSLLDIDYICDEYDDEIYGHNRVALLICDALNAAHGPGVKFPDFSDLDAWSKMPGLDEAVRLTSRTLTKAANFDSPEGFTAIDRLDEMVVSYEEELPHIPLLPLLTRYWQERGETNSAYYNMSFISRLLFFNQRQEFISAFDEIVADCGSPNVEKSVGALCTIPFFIETLDQFNSENMLLDKTYTPLKLFPALVNVLDSCVKHDNQDVAKAAKLAKDRANETIEDILDYVGEYACSETTRNRLTRKLVASRNPLSAVPQ